MKACLVLTDAGSTRFAIQNYGKTRMLAIRDAWPDIKRCLDLAVSLLDQFGLTAVNLNARSVVHPLAYYIKRRNLDASYLAVKTHEADREQVRQWVLRSLLRQGIWGSGLDTLLTRIRGAIKDYGANGFPHAEIEQAMADVGKSLAFDEEAVQGLLKLRYSDRNSYALLSLIYPSGDTSRRHVDHIYPQAAFTRAKLEKLGCPLDDIPSLIGLAQEIPNLQLLTPAENESKGDQMPRAWLDAGYADETHRAAVQAFHHFGPINEDMNGFAEFVSVRRDALAKVIRTRLGVSDPAGDGPGEPSVVTSG